MKDRAPGAAPRIAAVRRLLTEALVIVGSILLAFALDAWWDARGERIEERTVLQSLRSEFETAKTDLDGYIEGATWFKFLGEGSREGLGAAI